MKYLIALAALIAAVPALAQTTTRVEPRPFYGATVTLEKGVRVWRPLPPHREIIIDPTMGYWADEQPRRHQVPGMPPRSEQPKQ